MHTRNFGTLPELFLTLDAEDRRDIYTDFAFKSGRAPHILEKDVWVCWTLGTIFTLDGALPMTFKGGTSLSKVFDAISRFSEDVDVTVAREALDPEFDPFADSHSNSAIRRISQRLDSLLSDHIREIVAPGLRLTLQQEFGFGPESVVVDPGSPLDVFVQYPTAMQERPDYVEDRVKIEFGGRNSIAPSEHHSVVSYLAAGGYDVDLPKAQPNVLSPQRTFWEKATLAHVECNRSAIRAGAERISRHWYDLDQLALGVIGQDAIKNRALLEDVVRHKTIFYNSSTANYAACLSGELRLVPNGAGQSALQADYEAMVSAKMIDGEVPDFVDILARLSEVEALINGM